MKKILIFLLFVVMVLFTGCDKSNQHYVDGAVINYTNESFEYSTESTTKRVCSEPTNSFITELELLQPRNLNRTIDTLTSEWTEDDIIVAWEMTDASNVYSEYTDRIFLDFNFDQNFEMILTSYSTEKMYLFEKRQHDIILLDSTLDIDITNGYVFIPHTDEENICEHEVYDFQECRDFNFKTIKNNIYISGISWRSELGKTYWIKEVKFDDEKIIFSDLYRWGEFRTGEQMIFDFEYRKYKKDGTFEFVQKEEIDDFLIQLI